MDYEPQVRPIDMEAKLPTGTYLCTTCNMLVDVTADNLTQPRCPCCEQPVFMDSESDGYLNDSK